jgi:MFS family permease
MLFLLNGLTYLFSGLCVSFITIPQTMPEKTGRWRDQLDEFKRDTLKGFRYVWNSTGLRELIFVSAFLTFFTVPVIILLPFYVEDYLGAEPDWYGFLLAAYGVGAMVGFAVAGSIKLSGTARGRWLMIFIVMEAVGYGLLGLIKNPAPAMVLAIVGGITGGFVTVHITTILQLTTPGDMRGRVFGLLATVSGSLAPLAMGLAGVVADLVNQNIPLIYVSCGAIMLVLSVAVFLNRDVREYLAYEAEEESSMPIEHQVVPLK